MNRADLGAVTTQRLSVGSPTEPFVCASGAELPGIEIAFETYGELNDDRSNAVYVCHALTGDAHAAAHHDGDRPGWWGNLIGPGKPLDTDRFFVICANLLGGCQGTTGPASINPETDRVYGLEFPLLQVSDFVSAHREVIKSLGISKLAAAIGGSLGGMQVLDWSLSHPEELGAAVIIAASSRLTAQNIAFSAVARSAIMRDPNFQEGRFLDNGTRPDLGLAIARMMAHITYLSEPAMSEKFGRTMTDQASPGFGTDFQVESYLNHQGNTFLNRFDALSYLYLTRAMDFFDPFAGENAFERVRQNPVNYLVISFDSDWRFSTEHSLRIAAKLEHNRLPVTFREIQCSWGHDSFLLADPDYHATIASFFKRIAQEVGSA